MPWRGLGCRAVLALLLLNCLLGTAVGADLPICMGVRVNQRSNTWENGPGKSFSLSIKVQDGGGSNNLTVGVSLPSTFRISKTSKGAVLEDKGSTVYWPNLSVTQRNGHTFKLSASACATAASDTYDVASFVYKTNSTGEVTCRMPLGAYITVRTT